MGADLLLIVAGDDLVPHGGLRAFWIQAKRNAAVQAEPHKMNYSHSNTNTVGQRQHSALQAEHDPAQGSFSPYWLYSPDLPYIPAASLSQFTLAGPTAAPTNCTVDLGLYGRRLQELMGSLLVNQAHGAFTPDALVAFLLIAAKAGVLPLQLVTLAGARHLDALAKLEYVVDEYSRRVTNGTNPRNNLKAPRPD